MQHITPGAEEVKQQYSLNSDTITSKAFQDPPASAIPAFTWFELVLLPTIRWIRHFPMLKGLVLRGVRFFPQFETRLRTLRTHAAVHNEQSAFSNLVVNMVRLLRAVPLLKRVSSKQSSRFSRLKIWLSHVETAGVTFSPKVGKATPQFDQSAGDLSDRTPYSRQIYYELKAAIAKQQKEKINAHRD